MNAILASAVVSLALALCAVGEAGRLVTHHDLGATSFTSEIRSMGHARGTFDVTVTPQTMTHAAGAGPRLGRLSLDKTYHGDLEATAVGEMLAGGTSEKTSAGYVAMEEVRGTLNGRRGSFLLQHSGTLNRGAPSLTVTVVPDSGTEELIGLSGSLTIIIEGKKHSYEFEFSLPGAPQ